MENNLIRYLAFCGIALVSAGIYLEAGTAGACAFAGGCLIAMAIIEAMMKVLGGR